MKKLQQILSNNEVKDVYTDLITCIDHFGARNLGRLRSCTATVYETYGYTYLKSYNTIIACIGHDNNVCYDFLRMVYGYTSTSAQHIAKFANDFRASSRVTYYPV